MSTTVRMLSAVVKDGNKVKNEMKKREKGTRIVNLIHHVTGYHTWYNTLYKTSLKAA